MTYRLAELDGCHWRRLTRTRSFHHAVRLRRALAAVGIEADVRRRAGR
jgi:hypothetical protein